MGSLIFLGSRDKNPRDKAARALLGPLRKRASVSGSLLCPLATLPATSQHVSPSRGCKFKGLHLKLQMRTRGLDTQEPTTVFAHHACAYTPWVCIARACRVTRESPQLRAPMPPCLSASRISHLSEHPFSREQQRVWKESFVFLQLEINMEPGNHLCSFPVFVPMP